MSIEEPKRSPEQLGTVGQMIKSVNEIIKSSEGLVKALSELSENDVEKLRKSVEERPASYQLPNPNSPGLSEEERKKREQAVWEHGRYDILMDITRAGGYLKDVHQKVAEIIEKGK